MTRALPWRPPLLARFALARLPWESVAIVAFRWLVVACQAATILISWPVWGVHANPPMLPALPLPQAPTGQLLLLSLALVLVWARLGIAVHTALLLYAVLADQTRLQPEVVSLDLLLWATLPGQNARTLGRFHLVTLWCFAGLNKLFSDGFMHGTAQWMLSGLYPDAPTALRDNFGYLVALGELSVGVLAFIPVTRRLAAVAALVLHSMILLDLSPMGLHWNEVIWPWNVALAFAGFALIWPWRGWPWQSFQTCDRRLKPLLILLVLAPIGFYLTITDAYLAHNLYSSNTATSSICGPRTGCYPGAQVIATFEAFDVPMPPEPRLFRASFRKTCTTGQWLEIQDPRWLAQRRGHGLQIVPCPS